jgi:tetratricopeptide (TPR) repeat protein
MTEEKAALELAVAHARAGRLSAAEEQILATLDAGEREFSCYVALAKALLDADQLGPAIDAYIRALTCEHARAEAAAARYEIGDAYERLGKLEQALHYFRVVAFDAPAFEDGRGSVSERILRLSKPEPPDETA